MSTKQSTVDFLLEQMQDAGMLRAHKMFGEYGVYCNEKIVALVCDDMLFVKICEGSRKFLTDADIAPPYPGAKNYFKVPEDTWDDRDWMSNLISETAASLPLPKKKK